MDYLQNLLSNVILNILPGPLGRNICFNTDISMEPRNTQDYVFMLYTDMFGSQRTLNVIPVVC